MRTRLFAVLMALSLAASAQTNDSLKIELNLPEYGRHQNIGNYFLVVGSAFLITSIATKEKKLLVPASVATASGFYFKIRTNKHFLNENRKLRTKKNKKR